jgi:methyltransferase
MNLLLLGTLVFIPMLLEAVVSRRNERELRAMGATEPADDVFHLMQLAYPAAFLAILAEGWLRGPRMDTLVPAGFAIFVGAKLLKYWAVISLGPRWTFRVLVPPGSSLVVLGPYRMLRHPNYIAVMAELVGAALIAHALIAGVCAVVVFALLIRRRIFVEERALGLRAT